MYAKKKHPVIRSVTPIIFLIVAGLLGLLTLQPAMADDYPVKVALKANGQIFDSGDTVVVEVQLQNAGNSPAKAPENLSVGLRLKLPSGDTQKRNVEIKKGLTSGSTRINVQKPGMYELESTDQKLLNSAVYFKVRAPTKKVSKKPAAAVKRSASAGMQMKLPSIGTAKPSISTGQKIERPVQAKPETRLTVALKVSPDEPRLADGNDAAKIHALLIGDNAIAPTNIQLRLYNNAGQLTPDTLVIPEGGFQAEGELKSKNVGPVTVEHLGSVPRIEIAGQKKIDVYFRPPVTRFELVASPPSISLLEKAEFIVRLLDERGNILADDRPHDFSFRIVQGRGDIEPESVKIPAGKTEARVVFQPTEARKVVIEATTSKFWLQEGELQVNWPFIILTISAAGALVGGLLSFLLKKDKDSKWWMIFTGLVFGFILYWAALFGLLKVLHTTVVLNPFSAFCISVIGGWLGPKTIDLVLKKFGIQA